MFRTIITVGLLTVAAVSSAAQSPTLISRPILDAASPSPPGATELAVDDGLFESTISTPNYDEFIWMNVLSPPPGVCEYRVETIRVLWPSAVNVGDLADLYIYADPDGDLSPATGAVLLHTMENISAQFSDDATFSDYPLGTSVELTDCAKLVVALVNRGMTGDGVSPAALDTSDPQGRSWAGIYGGPVPQPPVLPAPTFGPIGDLAPNDGNFAIRALVSVVVSTEGVPASVFELGPSFPNPARDTATYRLTLNEPSEVQIHVLDILGREVKAVEGKVLSAGEHEWRIETSKLTPSQYILVFVVGSHMQTNRLTVVK